MKKVIKVLSVFTLIFIATLCVRSFATDVGTVTTVIDADTGLPISGAKVTYQYDNWGDLCGKPITVTTNKNGRVHSPKSSVCAMTVTAPGYHYNGFNVYEPGTTKELKLYRQLHTDIPNKVNLMLYKDGGVNMLDNLTKPLSDKAVTKTQPMDFQFTNINYFLDTPDEGDNGNAHIKFYGDGGIQVISDKKPLNLGGTYLFDMENLRTAPIDGYAKEMNIVPGKSYVARLRDGKHYFKFYVNGISKPPVTEDVISKYPASIEVTIFANPTATQSLDFLDISNY